MTDAMEGWLRKRRKEEVMMKIAYECTLCGERFYDERECAEHEAKHLTPEKIIGHGKYEDTAGTFYPGEITVELSNGARVVYKFDRFVFTY